MLDETGQTVADTTGTSTTTVPTTFFEPDGTLKEGWIGGLEEETKADKGLAYFKNVKDLAKSYVSARKMIGRDKIAVPNENSTSAEWDEYFKAGGRPTTPDDYRFEYPKDMPVEEDKDLLKSWQTEAHKFGLSQKQAKFVYDFYNNLVKQIYLQQDQADELAERELMDGLYRDWGNALEQKKHFGNVAVEQGVDSPKHKERLLEKFGDDPDFIRFAGNIGSKFAEHKFIPSNIPTPADIQTRIDDIMHSDAYIKRDHPGHQAAIDLVQKLFEERNRVVRPVG